MLEEFEQALDREAGQMLKLMTLRRADTSVRNLIQEVAVFQAGRWNGCSYSEHDLADMIANHEVDGRPEIPVVLGHDSSCVLGTARNLRRQGDHLLADLDLQPRAMAAVVEGRLEGVSARIPFRHDPAPGYAVEHIGLVPAGIRPACKNLPLLRTYIERSEFL